MKWTVVFSILLLTTALCLTAQMLPKGAHVNLYFPHLTDGGPDEAQWQTTFKFGNPNAKAVTVQIHFHDDAGQPLALDFGSGPVASMKLTIPAGGSRVIRSRMASKTSVGGWAEAYASLPLQATAAYRLIRNGTAVVEITAEPTLPTHSYSAAATGWMGLAVANPYNDRAIKTDVILTDGDGRYQGTAPISAPALGHKAVNLVALFPEVTGSFNGTVRLVSDSDYFLAWAVASDGAIISSLPPGRAAWPISHWDQIWNVYQLVEDAAQGVLDAAQIPVNLRSPAVRLDISTAKMINAQASSNGEIQITYALSELISDSPSELAFVLAHELGHIVQFRSGRGILLPKEPEVDADLLGMLFILSAGFDPYAGSGALAKVSMAYNNAGLVSQYLKEHYDIHRSEGTRISAMFAALETLCSGPGYQNICQEYKRLVHPHFPDEVPLGIPDPPGTPATLRDRTLLAPSAQ